MPPRIPGTYNGLERKLVLAFDVGTTYSNVAYCILDPGQVPEVKSVTRYPGMEHCSESPGIPTVIYYDQRGNVAAVGAETLGEDIYEQAEDEGWQKAEWFKLHIRPKRDQGSQRARSTIPPLPAGKTVVQVFADFLTYLLRCARAHLEETNGWAIWESVKDSIDYVLSHPNSWEGFQQSTVREAAVLAGLVPDSERGRSHISFVTDGEASLYFAMWDGLPKEAFERDTGVIVVEAGDRSIEIRAYASTFHEAASLSPFREVAPPQCHFHGSAFVSIIFRLFLEEYLAESDFVEDIDHIVRCFDKTTKLRFANPKRPQYVKFGSTRDNDPDANIRFGQLKLNGLDVASFFSPSIKCIVDALNEVRKKSHMRLNNAVLVGSFGANDWLYHQVAESSQKMGLSLYRPDVHQCEAFRAVGAVSSYLHHQVATHVARMAHQTEVTYEALKLEHFKGGNLMYLSTTSGTQTMRDYFRVIVPFEFKRRFYQVCNNQEEFSMFKAKVYTHRGAAEDGLMDENEDNFKQLCTITLDLSQMTPKQAPIQGQRGKFHYHFNYTLHIFFGNMGLKAQVGWIEGGVETRSDGQIVSAE